MDKKVFKKMLKEAIVQELRKNLEAPKKRLSESNYVSQLLKQAKAGVESGQEVTVKGQKVVKVIPFAGAFKTEQGSVIKISDLENPESDILIGGKTVSLVDPKPFPTTEPSPEEKAQRQKDWEKRYGWGGGRETGAGFYTGD